MCPPRELTGIQHAWSAWKGLAQCSVDIDDLPEVSASAVWDERKKHWGWCAYGDVPWLGSTGCRISRSRYNVVYLLHFCRWETSLLSILKESLGLTIIGGAA